MKVVLGDGDTFWIEHGHWAAMRTPVWDLSLPSRFELRQALRRHGALLATYNLPVDHDHPPNGLLYVIEGDHYDRKDCRSSARKSLNYSQKYLTFAEVTIDQLKNDGYNCYKDTRIRNGLSDVTILDFQDSIERKKMLSNVMIQAAYKDNRMVAFMVSSQVGEIGELQQHCSLTDAMTYEPNEMLYFLSLQKLINERGARFVSAGTTSLQPGVNLSGLHWFKTKMGFKAVEIHRCFFLHPILALLASRPGYRTIRLLSSLFPRSKHIRKGMGMLSLIMQEKHGQALRVDMGTMSSRNPKSTRS
jgi:hypothetical protein